MNKQLFTVNEVSELLAVSRTRVYELIRKGGEEGGIASLRIGGRRRISASAIEEFLRSIESESGQTPN